MARRAVAATVLLVGLTSCSGSSSAPSHSTAPALKPSGPTARTVDYRCVGGRLGTITATVPDPHKIASVLNPINVCEFDGGLAEVTMTVSCAGGSPARIHLVATDGELPATASASC